MLPKSLLPHVLGIEPFLPRTRALELAIGVGVGLGKAVYLSQQQHWVEWLEDHAGRPVAEGRDPQSVETIYNRIKCPPMLLWLAEGAGVPEAYLDRAHDAVVAAPPRSATRCAALRWAIPWAMVERALTRR